MARDVVVSGGPSGYLQEIVTGMHRLHSDEPMAAGGADAGPNPYELLLAALGACTSITLRMYADRKPWAREGVEVRLRHSRIHATDCAECETKQGMLDHVEREISVRGPLTREQKERLLEIAGRCPVHRTLTSEIHIETRLT